MLEDSQMSVSSISAPTIVKCEIKQFSPKLHNIEKLLKGEASLTLNDPLNPILCRAFEEANKQLKY